MGDKYNRLPRLLPDLQQLILQQLPGLGIDSPEGLIHQQYLRIVCERAGNGHALLHAARQLIRIAVGETA
ncbi:hypothetical protein D3C72_2281620 [compost metagenome]